MKNHFLLIIILCLVLFTTQIEGFVINMKSSITGNTYEVQEYQEMNKAVDLIAKLDQNINKFANYLFKKYPNNKKIQQLYNNLQTTKYEEAPHTEGESTYTINKGELIKICLRHKKENKPLHNLNTLMFVVIHEMAHVMSVSIGHNEEFMTNFRFLLREADGININYEPIDYSKENMTYCGVHVSHNPYYNHT